MSVPDNGIVKLDGRIGPFWEHYFLTAGLPFWGLKLAYVYGYAGFWLPYITLVVCVPIAYYFHVMDRRSNSRGISDEVDQRVPLYSRISGMLFLITLAIVLYQDFGYDPVLERWNSEVREMEQILETVPQPNTGGEIV